MFTGIIEECGTVQRIGGGTLRVAAQHVLQDVRIGDSISVNGICLTVTAFSARHFTADVMPETVRRTSLADLSPGSPVNLERALQVGARLGGHFVSGHIDGTGEVQALRREGNAVLLTVAAVPKLLSGIVEKGSVALDGISLTVVAVTDTDFTVSLIPHTAKVTNLRAKKSGSRINIETDILGKYVEKLLAEGLLPRTGSSSLAGTASPAASSPFGAGTASPAAFSSFGAGTASPAAFSPFGAGTARSLSAPLSEGGGPRSGGGCPPRGAAKCAPFPSAGTDKITEEFLHRNGF